MSDEKERAGVRDAERRLFAQYGLAHHEHFVADATVGWRVRVVEIDGDSDRPPIVLLHGITSVTAPAVPLIPSFGGRRVLAVDLPGHGLADPFTVPRGQDLGRVLATLIPRVLDQFGIDRADVVAHSLGGQIALRTAVAHSARVNRLVLLGAPGAGFAGVEPLPAMRVAAVPWIGTAALRLPASPQAYRRNGEAVFGAHAFDRLPADVAEAINDAGWHASRLKGHAASIASYFRALITPTRGIRPGVTLTATELASITVPTLMIWGEDDVFLRPAHGAPEFQHLAQGTLHVIPGGHAPWLDDPVFVGSTVGDFLNVPQPENETRA
jgi:pimeloyl-ACP methyl ester carboxylesterase